MDKKRKLYLQIIVRIAVLAAINVVLMNYLGIHTKTMKLNFAFIPIAVCGMLYGAGAGAFCAGLGDILNCLLSPFGWYPPLTLTACLNGWIYGFFLKNKSESIINVILAVVIFQVAVSFGLNTFFLSLLYQRPFIELAVTRIPQTLIMIPLQIVVLRAVGNRKFINLLAGTSVASE